MPESQGKLAESYFDYLAKRFPVMCASDEFHFLPRAAAASRYYDRMECLDPGFIEECIFTLREFQTNFNLLASCEDDLERLIDLELLRSSIAGILIELEENPVWRRNPLLYLKIAFIGLDHALTKPADNHKERIERTLARLSAIPNLLRRAAGNLDFVPETYHQATFAMLNDCGRYLRETAQGLATEDAGRLAAAIEAALSSLRGFRQIPWFSSTCPGSETCSFRSRDNLAAQVWVGSKSVRNI